MPSRPAETAFPHIAGLAHALRRPVCILDTETTGLATPKTPQVGLVEFAYLKVDPDGTQNNQSMLVNPSPILIHWAATKTHGIAWQDVRHAPRFSALTEQIDWLARTCVISGFNSTSYDIPVLRQNFERCGNTVFRPEHLLDVRSVWIKANQGSSKGTLAFVAGHYGIAVPQSHRAMADVLTTAALLEVMIERHGLAFVIEKYTHTPHSSAVPTPAPSPVAPQPRQAKLSPPLSVWQSRPAHRPRPAATHPDIHEQGREAINEFVRERGCILEKDFEAVGKPFGLTARQIESKVDTMLEAGNLAYEDAADPSIQHYIDEHLEMAIAMVGREKLTPIKTYLDRAINQPVSYIQLRLALGRRDQEHDHEHDYPTFQTR